MGEKRVVDYIYTDGNEKILIESLQTDTRHAVIDQYIRCRKAKKMTQADLARRTGIARPNITRFESGSYNPSLEFMVKIAAALDMHLELRLQEND